MFWPSWGIWISERGACWARSLAFGLFSGEDYLLQVDSHTYFTKDWDEKLVNTLSEVSKTAGNPRVVLSTRPPAFELDNDFRPVIKPFIRNALIIEPKAGSVFDNDHPVLLFSAVDSGKMEPVPGYQLAAGFIFLIGTFIEDIPYDPGIYFHDEEQNLSIRAFTRGWDIWHPSEPPLYHRYRSLKDECIRPMHWCKEYESQRSSRCWTFECRSKIRIRELLWDRSVRGIHGLGRIMSLEDFASHSGIDCSRRTVSVCAL